jgi:hypothetical protein
MREMMMEDSRYDQVINRIRELDINIMTPLAALNTLQDLKDEVLDAGK